MNNPVKLYRAFLKLYPARFREEYAAVLERDFRDEHLESGGGLLFWARILADLGVSIPVEMARELSRDLRHSVRLYAKRPLVTGLILAALAMSIGATTGVFSVVNALLLKSLPFRTPERIVLLDGFPGGSYKSHKLFDADWDRAYLEDAMLFNFSDMNLVTRHDPVRAKVTETSANFFQTLGSDVMFGRSFLPDEDLPGKDGVAVISHALWEQVYGGDPRILGSTVHINGTPITIIGVANPGMDFPDKTAVWTPTTFDIDKLEKYEGIYWRIVGRLKPGVTMSQAQSMYRANVERVCAGRCQSFGSKSANTLALVSMRQQLAGSVGQASFVLLGAVVFVLLIACANVANLLLARISERRKEMVIRAALGASRSRLVQQLITECILLSVIATAAGLLIARWATALAAMFQPAQLSAQQYSILDVRVFGFAAGLAIVTGLLFGVFPAYLASRLQPSDELRLGRGSSSGASRLRQILIAAQVTFTLVLLAGSIVLGRAFLTLLGTDLGFKAGGVVSLSVSLPHSTEASRERTIAYYHDAMERLRAVPGVESAGIISQLPLGGRFYSLGRFKFNSAREFPLTQFLVGGPGYLSTLGVNILAGRDLEPRDSAGSEPVILINDTLAQALGGIQSTLGRQISAQGWGAPKPMKIVGVYRSVRQAGPAHDPFAQMIAPYAQLPVPFMTFVARVHGHAEDYLPVCRDAIQSIDRNVPLFGIGTLEDRLREKLARPRFYTTAVLFFGVFALLLALIGIYGVASYSVTQRTHELGVRLAAGARAHEVRLLLLRQSLLPILAGTIAGIAGAAALGKSLVHLIESAGNVNYAICLTAAALLAVVAITAIWTATGRVLRLDPMQILRAE
ncbi:MAG TPA: ABC transporter permease [Bryobacteraceae bacterium]|nr:ABC transporter permease [Bryobacteraceae bacterium]